MQPFSELRIKHGEKLHTKTIQEISPCLFMNTAATSAEQSLKKCSVSLKPTNSLPARNAKARKPARNFRRWRRSVQAIPVQADTPAVAARAAALAEQDNFDGRAPYFPIKFSTIGDQNER
jgi:hypothetical protein